ncbi:MAG: hypothetical protein VKN17_01145 [Cyanobacteriota bacterium]|nr:hypothetical protein [Cyanobacteriota bacterium]
MGVPLPRPAALVARLEASVEEWPYLDKGVLVKTRSRKVCMSGHLRQGLIAHGEHLVSRCQGWTDDMTRQKGWISDGRRVLHFRPLRYDRWSQSLELTLGKVCLPGSRRCGPCGVDVAANWRDCWPTCSATPSNTVQQGAWCASSWTGGDPRCNSP